MEKTESITSSVVFYITPTQVLFMALAAIAIGEEIILHAFPTDFLFWGGLFSFTSFVPALIVIAARMSQRVGYTLGEKQKMTRDRLRFTMALEREFRPAPTLGWTLLCISGVLGINVLAGILAMQDLMHAMQVFVGEYGFYFIGLAIAENLKYQVALMIGLTAMLRYPRRTFGIPCAIIYVGSMIAESFETDPYLRIAINVIPIVVFAIFFPLAKRDIEPPSRGFNYAMALVSAVLFFLGHFNTYGASFWVWIGIAGDGLIMSFVYVKTRNVAVTTWAHVLLNILSLPMLILTAVAAGAIV